MTRNRLRIAHVAPHPVPYFAPLYREIAGRPDVDLTVYFCSDETLRAFYHPSVGRALRWDADLLGGYKHRLLPSARRTRVTAGPRLRPNVDIAREIASEQYDAVWVHGYAYTTAWMAAAAALRSGARLLVREEQTLLDRRPRGPRAVARELALRALLARAHGLYIGEQNRRFLRRYGVPESRLTPARYCVDNAYFAAEAARLRPRRDELRARFGVTDDRPVVLFVGRMIEKKRPLLLLDAFARIRRERACALVIAGDGPLRAAAESAVAARAIPDVHFAGFLNQSELPAAYAAADVFTLPSSHHETWGLVVNEAMNFSLPAVVTDRVGCAEDLVHNTRSGTVVRPDDAASLAAALAHLIDDRDRRERYGAESRCIVSRYTVAAAADGIVSAAAVSAAPAKERSHAA
jgi:glycosyltransferase involved in cell wall biosynthesis